MWTTIWISWLAFLIVADIIANREPGATFSEHCRVWFRTWTARLILALFFIALYLHFVINLNVLPVVGLGSGIVFFIVRKGNMDFRWDKWISACVFAGLTTVLAGGAASFFTDGSVSKGEIIIMLGMFFTGAGAWMKTHPVEWDGTERRNLPPVDPNTIHQDQAK